MDLIIAFIETSRGCVVYTHLGESHFDKAQGMVTYNLPSLFF